MHGLFDLAQYVPAWHQRTYDAFPTRKTFHYKLKPTAQQAVELERIHLLCRTLYNCALPQRRTRWGRCQGRDRASTLAQQEAELPALESALPEYQAVCSPVLHDVLACLDQSYQAFVGRLVTREQPGFPRFTPATRYASLISKPFVDTRPG